MHLTRTWIFVISCHLSHATYKDHGYVQYKLPAVRPRPRLVCRRHVSSSPLPSAQSCPKSNRARQGNHRGKDKVKPKESCRPGLTPCCSRPGLTMFTDGSRLDDGATGYSVMWKRGLTWAGAKVHMGNNQEAYGEECATLAHALELAAQRSSIRNESRSFRTHRQLSGGWHRTNLAPANSTPSRRGNTSPHCAGPGGASSSKSDGAQLTRESLAMRRPMSEQRSQQGSRTPTGWSG